MAAQDPARLYAILMNTGLQQKDQPLYQVLHDLIGTIVGVNTTITKVISGVIIPGGPGGSIIGKQGIAGLDGIDGVDGIDDNSFIPTQSSFSSSIIDDNATNANMFLVWVKATPGNEQLETSSTGLIWNPAVAIGGALGIDVAPPDSQYRVTIAGNLTNGVSALSLRNNLGSAPTVFSSRVLAIVNEAFTQQLFSLNLSSTIVQLIANAAGGVAMGIELGTSLAAPLTLKTNNLVRWTLYSSGGFSNTGSDPGATNVAIAGNLSVGGLITGNMFMPYPIDWDDNVLDELPASIVASAAALLNAGLNNFLGSVQVSVALGIGQVPLRTGLYVIGSTGASGANTPAITVSAQSVNTVASQIFLDSSGTIKTAISIDGSIHTNSYISINGSFSATRSAVTGNLLTYVQALTGLANMLDIVSDTQYGTVCKVSSAANAQSVTTLDNSSNFVHTITATGQMQWGASNTLASMDVALARNAAGVLEINNTTLGTFADLKARNITTSGTLIDKSYNIATPATLATVTMSANQQRQIINPAGTIAVLTVTLPPSPVDGQIAAISFTQIVSALTINAPGGATVVGPPTNAAVNSQFQFLYQASSTSWFPSA